MGIQVLATRLNQVQQSIIVMQQKTNSLPPKERPAAYQRLADLAQEESDLGDQMRQLAQESLHTLQRRRERIEAQINLLERLITAEQVDETMVTALAALEDSVSTATEVVPQNPVTPITESAIDRTGARPVEAKRPVDATPESGTQKPEPHDSDTSSGHKQDEQVHQSTSNGASGPSVNVPAPSQPAHSAGGIGSPVKRPSPPPSVRFQSRPAQRPLPLPPSEGERPGNADFAKLIEPLERARLKPGPAILVKTTQDPLPTPAVPESGKAPRRVPPERKNLPPQTGASDSSDGTSIAVVHPMVSEADITDAHSVMAAPPLAAPPDPEIEPERSEFHTAIVSMHPAELSDTGPGQSALKSGSAPLLTSERTGALLEERHSSTVRDGNDYPPNRVPACTTTQVSSGEDGHTHDDFLDPSMVALYTDTCKQLLLACTKISLAKSWLFASYFEQSGGPYPPSLPRPVDIEIASQILPRLVQSKNVVLNDVLAQTLNSAAQDADSQYQISPPQAHIRLALGLPLLVFGGSEAAYTWILAARDQSDAPALRHWADESCSFWQRTHVSLRDTGILQDVEVQQKRALVARQLREHFENTTVVTVNYLPAAKVKAKLFPRQGDSGLRWILDAVQDGDLSRVQAWLGSFDAEAEIDRCTRLVSSFRDKVDYSARSKLVDALLALQERAREWCSTFQDKGPKHSRGLATQARQYLVDWESMKEEYRTAIASLPDEQAVARGWLEHAYIVFNQQLGGTAHA